MTKKITRAVLTVFLLVSAAVSAQPVASSGDGLLLSEPATFSTRAATPTPLFLDTLPASMPVFPDADPMGVSLRILSSLFAVIILAFGISWFIQKRGGLGGNVFGKVLGILPLDNRRMLYIVDVMGRVLILGVTETNINLLGELTDKDTLDSLRLQDNQPSPGMEKLFSFLSLKNKTPDASTEAPSENEPADLGNVHHLRQQERKQKLSDMLLKRSNPEDQKKDS